MEFFNDLGKRFTRVAKSVQERTREGLESTRLNADLYSLRNDLERQYTALGEAYFKAQLSGEEVSQELFSKTKATYDRIEELTAQKENRTRCPACGAYLAENARFCSKCGHRMPEEAPEIPQDDEDESEYCPVCGAMRHEDTEFCAVCGHPFAAKDEKPPEKAPEQPVEPAKDIPEEPDYLENQE